MTEEKVVPMSTVSKLMAEAKDELNEYIQKKHKRQIKEKMKALTTAKRVVANIEGELEDLGIKIAKELE
ncbi:MAG: hypothetical protein PF440_12010 [Thiomicrorhabdus sp.]|jgi:hypothetical protein|nr:hypothetical protein [Thiomicrorhabdus sp.]